MTSPRVIIPSAGRAGAISTPTLVPECTVFVPESEAAAYRLKLGGMPGVEVVAHPDSLRGIVAKRQAMLERWADEDIVMLDDDIMALRNVTLPGGEPQDRSSPEFVRALLESTVATAANLGAYLFGWATSGVPMHYRTTSPMTRVGFILGGAMGFRKGHGLHFDTSLQVHEDYDICALNAFKHRTIFKDFRFAFVFSKTFHNSGGLALVRTAAREDEAVARLRQKWGDDVIRAKRKVNPWQADYAGGKKITVKFPF